MLHRLRLALVFLCLVTLLPNAAIGDDKKEDGDDPKDAPKKEAPTKDAPKKDAPKKDAPKKDDAKPGDPAPGEDEPAAPAPGTAPEDAPEDDPDADPAEDPEDALKDEAKKEGKDEPKKAPARTYEQVPSPAPVPAGQTFVQGGTIKIGSEQAYLDGILAGRPADHRKLFLYETPYHKTFLRPYFIGKYEITNAQYKRFLLDSAAVYDTASGSLANLDEIAAFMVRLSKDQQQSAKTLVWRQLYFANKDVIWKAFEKRINDFMVRRADGKIDEVATAKKFRFTPLPRTIKLKFYNLKPPSNWPDGAPLAGEEDHPVRFVSYNDAERFAEWAGMHLPLEAEWEWAARGPDGFVFPWGNDWPKNELYANWGGKIVDAAYMPTTLSVASRDGANPTGDKRAGEDGKKVPLDGDGRSWCGCHHMVGNVAEWTGSWFEKYRLGKFDHNFMGRWVKVIRGGGAGDGEMLVLRSACRNYVGGGPDAPPYPENDFPWVGFRLASYMKSGRDQIGPIVRRAVRAKKMHEEDLAIDHFTGAVTRNWVEPGSTPDNHVYILGRSNAIVVVPQKSFISAGERRMELMKRSWKRPTTFKTARGIKKKSETEHPFWTLGVIHTDIALENVQVREPEVIAPPTAKGKKKKKRGRAGRGRAKAPKTVKGICPAGTYLVGIWFGRLTLMLPSKEFVCFLPLAEGQKLGYEVMKLDAAEVTDPVVKVDPVFDWADLSFSIPLGGKSMDEKMHVVVTARIQFEVGSLEAAGTWIQEDPAAELTAEMRVKYDEYLKSEEKQNAKKKKRKGKDGKKTAASGK